MKRGQSLETNYDDNHWMPSTKRGRGRSRVLFDEDDDPSWHPSATVQVRGNKKHSEKTEAFVGARWQ